MKLHTYFRSSASFRVRIALALKGVEHDCAYVSLVKGEHATEAFRTLNPQALVPALEEGGRTLIQSLAIMEYLEERHPEPPLLPRDPLDRAYVRAVCGIVACEIHPLNNLRTLKHIRRTFGLDEAGVNTWYRHWIADGMAMLERYILAEGRAGRYAFGDAPTMADCCIVPQVFNARRYECDLDPYPRVMRVFDECMKLAAFDGAQPAKQADATP
jgi:maleylacetoacetate isomerase